MNINTHHIPGDGLSLEFSEILDIFPVLSELSQKGEFKPSSPVSINVTIMHITEDLFEVEGVVTLSLKLDCGRCLETYDHLLKKKFSLTYSKAVPHEVAPEGDEEIEIDENDISTVYFQGDFINLTETVQEQLTMVLPQHPLCNDACKGLCQKCGTNLNDSTCDCTQETGHPAFAALKALKTGK